MTHGGTHRKRSTIRIAVVVNIGLFLLIGFGFIEEYLRNREIEQEIARMNEENIALEERRLASLQLIETLSSEYFVEGEARQSGMGKEGESLVIVENLATNTTETSTSLDHGDIPNPLRWFYYFFDHARFDDLRRNV